MFNQTCTPQILDPIRNQVVIYFRFSNIGRLGRSIARLPDEYSVVLLLRDREGYSSQEVADFLGISVPAVKSRLHRARLFVRKELLGKSQKRLRAAEGAIP